MTGVREHLNSTTRLLALLFTVGTLSQLATAATCPKVACNATETALYDDNFCYSYNNGQVKVKECGIGQVCNLANVYKPLKDGFTDQEYFGDKRLVGFCGELDGMYKELMAGMPCLADFQCKYKTCDHGICRGGYGGDPCPDDEYCAGNYFCDTKWSLGLEWDVCKPARKTGELCNDERECQSSHVCSRRRFGDKKQCIERMSLDDGQDSIDPRLCRFGTMTNNNVCSVIRSIPETSCSVDAGMCPATMDVDNSIASRYTVPCACNLFDEGASCQWVDKETHEIVFSLGRKMYKQSPRCHRKYMADDLLETDWFHVRMCTDMKLSDFDSMVAMAGEITYYGPMNSDNYDGSCLNVFSTTGSSQYPGDYEPEIIRAMMAIHGLSLVSPAAALLSLFFSI